ncbi:GntR family transcriptional regulator [Poseidonibacter lekithochrous]|uniref:GntR family transcriptional regulator n=1 Tax=Poseidonibacter TaxID=2321187 RepID=UPI001C086868|nr:MULTISPECIES: GntR family transcriptional regulator [Poseidonibacter]MBU3015043.1 GntR family transcriptional regulator [Poseidonibacter lekithochrous]MDO6828340.1 GntR family transcriptional regulator [Poseidonibacter sp. 1_MG-2023]
MKNFDKPLYIKLYNKILENIENKKYNVNYKLPSENTFASEFNVNRHTVRQALQLLKDEGVIYTLKGKGNFISNIKIPYSISDKSSYSQRILDLGYEPTTEVLNVDIIEPNAEVAKKLGLNKNLNVIEIKLLRFANDLPITVSYSYFDAYLFRDIVNHLDMKPFSLYRVLNQCYPKMEITKMSTVFEALNPSAELSSLLNLHSNTPILSASTISKDQDGNLVEFGTSYSRADAVKIKVDLI